MEPPGVSPDLHALVQRLESGPDADSSAGAELFAESFLSLDPRRATVVSRAQLLAALPRRREMFAAAGIRRTRLQHLDARPLDERHQLARTTWAAELDDPDAEPLLLRSTFLLRLADGTWNVVVYLNHDDIGAELARRAAR